MNIGLKSARMDSTTSRCRSGYAIARCSPSRGRRQTNTTLARGDDIDFANKPKHGCGNKVFVAKPATQKVLQKYGITIDEYNEIADVLVAGLSFGYCGLCS